LFIHDTNFTTPVLAAMTIIIKFLPHHIAAGDRVAIASEVVRLFSLLTGTALAQDTIPISRTNRSAPRI
jgi:hypothetical protein